MGAGLLHPDYVWHDNAQVWQTPEAGEKAVAATLGAGAERRRAAYEGLGVPPDAASAMAEAFGDDMARCILGLYRDAAQPALADLGRQLTEATLPPGLVIEPSDDPYVPAELSAAMIEPLGAQRLGLDGRGHWWMAEPPAEAVRGLVAFWRGLDGGS